MCPLTSSKKKKKNRSFDVPQEIIREPRSENMLKIRGGYRTPATCDSVL